MLESFPRTKGFDLLHLMTMILNFQKKGVFTIGSSIEGKSIAFGTHKVVKPIDTPNYTKIQRKILYLARQNRVLWSSGDCEQNTFFILFELKIIMKSSFQTHSNNLVTWSPRYKNRTLPKIINPQQ